MPNIPFPRLLKSHPILNLKSTYHEKIISQYNKYLINNISFKFIDLNYSLFDNLFNIDFENIIPKIFFYSTNKLKSNLLNKLRQIIFLDENIITVIYNINKWYVYRLNYLLHNDTEIIISLHIPLYDIDKIEYTSIISSINTVINFININTQILFFKSNINNNKYINIDIFFLDNDKKIDNISKNKFNYGNINSGATINYNQILIWRKEEFSKVLIHELLHSLSYVEYKNIDNVNTYINDYLGISYSNKILLNESYVEAATVLIYAYINSIMEDKKSVNSKVFIDIITKEINFALFQFSKILFYSDIKSISKMDNYNETCSIISYYYLKSIILIAAIYKINNRNNDYITSNDIFTILKTKLLNKLINNNIINFQSNSIKNKHLQNTLRFTLFF